MNFIEIDKQKTINAENFVKNIKLIIQNYEPDQIFNTDQSGINYETYSQRTLANIGESTEVSANSLNAMSHSYTIQPVMSFEGKLVGKLLLCLQEINSKFGPRVENQLFKANNIQLVCSSSGKMTKELVKKFSQEILKPIVKNNFVLMLDSWQGHNKQEIYDNIFGNINCNLQVIPAGTTSYIQPLDKVLFGQ